MHTPLTKSILYFGKYEVRLQIYLFSFLSLGLTVGDTAILSPQPPKCWVTGMQSVPGKITPDNRESRGKVR